MAVEKMRLVNIIGRLSILDEFLEDIIKIDEIDQVSSLIEIQNRDFSFKASLENTDRIEDFNNIESFTKTDDKIIKNLEDIENNFVEDKRKIGKKIKREEIDNIYSKLQTLITKKKLLEEKKKKLENYLKNYEILRIEDIDIEKIQNLKYFSYRYGEISKEGRFILKNNYENIPSTIIHLDSEKTDIKTYKKYIKEVISIDDSTVELREQTNKILENERINVKEVSVRLDKEYELELKEKSKDLYESIISKADIESKKIEEKFLEERKNTKKIFDSNKENIIKSYVDKIKNI